MVLKLPVHPVSCTVQLIFCVCLEMNGHEGKIVLHLSQSKNRKKHRNSSTQTLIWMVNRDGGEGRAESSIPSQIKRANQPIW